MQSCEGHKMDKFETHASFTHIQGLLKKLWPLVQTVFNLVLIC